MIINHKNISTKEQNKFRLLSINQTNNLFISQRMIERFQNLTQKNTQQEKYVPIQIQQELSEVLGHIGPKLQQILNSLLAEMRQLQTKFSQQQKRLLRQIEQKDKLILSLTKINNGLLKENARMKKKSDAQFQYFVKRIAETECNALNDKKQLQERIAICESIISKLGGCQQIKRVLSLGLTTEQSQEKSGDSKNENIQASSVCSSPKTIKRRVIKKMLERVERQSQYKQRKYIQSPQLRTYQSMLAPNPQNYWQKPTKQLLVEL